MSAETLNSLLSIRPWTVGNMPLQRGALPLLMGIVNVTPDSSSAGGAWLGTQRAVDHALQLVNAGADSLDIGGASTRPGAEPVSLDDELRRVIPVIAAARERCTVP